MGHPVFKLWHHVTKCFVTLDNSFYLGLPPRDPVIPTPPRVTHGGEKAEVPRDASCHEVGEGPQQRPAPRLGIAGDGTDSLAAGTGSGGTHLAEIERLLLLEVWARPLLPVGDGSGRAP